MKEGRAHEGKKKRQISGAQQPQALLLYWTLACTSHTYRPASVSPSFTLPNPHWAPFSSHSQQGMALTDALLVLLHLHHPDFHASKEPHTLMGIWDPSYGLNDPGLFP